MTPTGFKSSYARAIELAYNYHGGTLDEKLVEVAEHAKENDIQLDESDLDAFLDRELNGRNPSYSGVLADGICPLRPPEPVFFLDDRRRTPCRPRQRTLTGSYPTCVSCGRKSMQSGKCVFRRSYRRKRAHRPASLPPRRGFAATARPRSRGTSRQPALHPRTLSACRHRT